MEKKTLEEIIEAGKRSLKFRQLYQEFMRNPALPIVPAIAEINGTLTDLEDEISQIPYNQLTPDEKDQFLNVVRSKAENKLVEFVQKDYRGVLDQITKDEKEARSVLLSILLDTKPVSFKESNEDFVKAHEKAYNLFQKAKDPDEYALALNERFKEKGEEDIAAINEYLFEKVPKLKEELAQRGVQKAFSMVYEPLKNVAGVRSYFERFYDHLDEKAQKQVASQLGLRLAQKELEKEAREKNNKK